MLLYRIRRKDTGQFFLGLKYPWSIKHGTEGWSPTGAFYRDPTTIESWLKVLCSDWRASRHLYPSQGWSAKRMSARLPDYDRTKLSLYEVVVSDVALLDERIINPEELVKP